jgi:hypothetical protein
VNCTLIHTEDAILHYVVDLQNWCTHYTLNVTSAKDRGNCFELKHKTVVRCHIHVSNFWSPFWFLGSVALDVGDMTEALKMFECCWHLRRQCLYRSHKDLTACIDQVAKCYSMLGKPTFLHVRFEGFTAVTMKNGVFWDVTPCGSRKNCFGGT